MPQPPPTTRLLNVFKTIPKELFRVNKGRTVTLRAFPVKPKGKFDLITVNGMVMPKALDPRTYTGSVTFCLLLGFSMHS